jgi:hypothetical protein
LPLLFVFGFAFGLLPLASCLLPLASCILHLASRLGLLALALSLRVASLPSCLRPGDDHRPTFGSAPGIRQPQIPPEPRKPLDCR